MAKKRITRNTRVKRSRAAMNNFKKWIKKRKNSSRKAQKGGLKKRKNQRKRKLAFQKISELDKGVFMPRTRVQAYLQSLRWVEYRPTSKVQAYFQCLRHLDVVNAINAALDAAPDAWKIINFALLEKCWNFFIEWLGRKFHSQHHSNHQDAPIPSANVNGKLSWQERRRRRRLPREIPAREFIERNSQQCA